MTITPLTTMPEEFRKPQRNFDQNSKKQNLDHREPSFRQSSSVEETSTDSREIAKKLKALASLSEYRIRDLVTDAQSLGEYLFTSDVKTNQIRKFLDAINRLKFDLAQALESTQQETAETSFLKTQEAQKVETELVMLQPKLAYAVARANKRQEPAIRRLNEVMSAAINKIREIKTNEDLQAFENDFARLVQLIESVIAYHKAKGGE